MLEVITFLLAPIGYAGLALTAVLSARGRMSVPAWRVVALVIVVHVLLVWTVRYEWQFAEATRNGYAGFILFHGALLAIVSSLFMAPSRARVPIIASFFVVTAGALGAVFLYDVVKLYRIPVIAFALAGMAGLVHAYRTRPRVAT
jgi:uncharacterized membrane protein